MKLPVQFFIFIILATGFIWVQANGGQKKRYTGEARTEVELMTNVLTCLHNKDSVSYYNLFPPFDTLWSLLLHNNSRDPEIVRELNNLKAHPTILIDMDPFYNHSIMARFNHILRKGEDSGIQWGGIVMQRYEVQKQGVAREMEGLQHIAPERFKGYMFVRDMMSSTTYCITITEIQKINGYFYGGRVINALEANTIDQYIYKEEEERKFLEKMRRKAEALLNDSATIDSPKLSPTLLDSMLQDTSLLKADGTIDSVKLKKKQLYTMGVTDEEASKMRKEVIDRRLYKGKFDEEIPVELYIRYMRDINGKVTNWDALYKFGDMQEYVKMEVTKTRDGTWMFEEPVATMELELAGKAYTGSWTNGANQTGYDADLQQTELSQEKILQLDYILENGIWGKTSEQKITEKDDPDQHEGKKGRKRKARKTKEADGNSTRPEEKKAPNAKPRKEDE